MNFELARFNMIEQQIRPWSVLDNAVLSLMASVKRELFLPEELRNLALSDTELDIGQGEVMLSPKVQARLIAQLQLKATDDVLQIGAGTGFMTCVMAQLAQSVLAYEIHPQLAKAASANLEREHISNAKVVVGDASKNSTLDKKFDAIIFCGSLAQVPALWLEKLKPEGRLLAIVGEEPVMRTSVYTRMADGSTTLLQPWDTCAPRLQHFAQAPSFVF